MQDAALRLKKIAEQLIGAPLPVRIRAWDRSEAGPPGTPVLVVRSRRALRHLLWKPGELGLARAWVAGDLDVDGDLFAALDLLAEFIWERGEDARGLRDSLRDPGFRAAARELFALSAPFLPPSPPPEEMRDTGRLHRHTKGRDRQAISHHYDVGNDFYEIVLGSSMVYSCAYWTGADAGYGLADAQRDKLDLICRKLDLKPGMRLLDVGCGWGSLALHAARDYGVDVVGITLSSEQADYARKQVAEAGLTERVEIRIQDYRDLDDGPFDAISSVGMAEHVGTEPYAEYAAILFRQLKAGGRLLNHQIAAIHPAPDGRRTRRRASSMRTSFRTVSWRRSAPRSTLLEQAGFEVRDVHALREHYARTLRAWVANLEADWRQGRRLTGPGRARVWRLYMAASALAFERSRIGVNQVLAVKTRETGASGLPLRARTWTA